MKKKKNLTLVHSSDKPAVNTAGIEAVVKAIKQAAEKRAVEAAALAKHQSERAVAIEAVRVRYLTELRDLGVEVLDPEKLSLIQACIRALAAPELKILPEEILLAVKRTPYVPAKDAGFPPRTRRVIRA